MAKEISFSVIALRANNSTSRPVSLTVSRDSALRPVSPQVGAGLALKVPPTRVGAAGSRAAGDQAPAVHIQRTSDVLCAIAGRPAAIAELEYEVPIATRLFLGWFLGCPRIHSQTHWRSRSISCRDPLDPVCSRGHLLDRVLQDSFLDHVAVRVLNPGLVAESSPSRIKEPPDQSS
jgi:hypothetical protein